MFKEFDTVELTHEIKKYGLKKCNLGAVVNIYNEGKSYEVEFISPSGSTIALLTLTPDDLLLYIKKGENLNANLDIYLYDSNASGMIYVMEAKSTLRGLDTIFGIDELEIEKNTQSNDTEELENLFNTTATL